MAKTTKKQTRDSHLTDLEKLGGVILLLIYLALIPLCGAAILNWAGGLLGFSIGPALRQTIWFYLLFAAVALVFHRFLFVCAGTFTGSAGRSFQTLGTALIFFYGLNEILFRVTHLLWGHTVNLNDTALVSLDLLNAAPRPPCWPWSCWPLLLKRCCCGASFLGGYASTAVLRRILSPAFSLPFCTPGPWRATILRFTIFLLRCSTPYPA